VLCAGTSRAATDLSCVPCPAGGFSAQNGSATCTAAPAGTYVNVTGSAQPTPCPSGARRSPVDHTARRACSMSNLPSIFPPVCVARSMRKDVSMGRSSPRLAFDPREDVCACHCPMRQI